MDLTQELRTLKATSINTNSARRWADCVVWFVWAWFWTLWTTNTLVVRKKNDIGSRSMSECFCMFCLVWHSERRLRHVSWPIRMLPGAQWQQGPGLLHRIWSHSSLQFCVTDRRPIFLSGAPSFLSCFLSRRLLASQHDYDDSRWCHNDPWSESRVLCCQSVGRDRKRLSWHGKSWKDKMKVLSLHRPLGCASNQIRCIVSLQASQDQPCNINLSSLLCLHDYKMWHILQQPQKMKRVSSIFADAGCLFWTWAAKTDRPAFFPQILAFKICICSNRRSRWEV